ncbi:MAG: IS1595 family transposase [Desulfobacterales bacterium]|nr:IS1595 family transposase [Desulfobacterales bacterium]
MKRKNKYIYRSKISEAKFREFVKFFSLDLEAKRIADLTHLNRNTVNRYSHLLRERIAFYCNQEYPFQLTNQNIDSSYSPNQPAKNTNNTHPLVVGIINKNKKIFSEIITSCTKDQLDQLARNGFSQQCIEINLNLRRFHAFVDRSFKHLYLLDANKKHLEYTCSKENVIESFTSFSRKRLLKFNGVSRSTFNLHLKECEFRYNCKNENTYQMMLKMCRGKPLN